MKRAGEQVIGLEGKTINDSMNSKNMENENDIKAEKAAKFSLRKGHLIFFLVLFVDWLRRSPFKHCNAA